MARCGVVAGLAVAALVASPATVDAQGPPDTIVALHEPSVFVPVTPVRVFHQALMPSPFGPFDQQVSLAAHVPAGATAVAVNFTSLRAGEFPGSGVSACALWRRGSCVSSFDTFDASAFNVASASDLAVLAVGAERVLSVSGPPGEVVVADLLGYYMPAGATPSAGRFKPVTPSRVLDTRDGGTMLDGSTVTVDLSSWLPADAAAAVVTLTVVDNQREGYLTAFAAGMPTPFVSNLLVLPPVHTVSNQAIVQLQDRKLTVLQTGRSHLLVDLAGYYTSASSTAGNDGLFVPTVGTELYNSFQFEGLPDPLQWTPPVPEPAGATITATYTPPVFGPTIGALQLRVDARLESPGFVNVWGPGSQPWTTDVFVDTAGGGHTSTAVTGVDGTAFHAYTSSSGWLRIVANGYFTAST